MGQSVVISTLSTTRESKDEWYQKTHDKWRKDVIENSNPSTFPPMRSDLTKNPYDLYPKLWREYINGRSISNYGRIFASS